MDVELPCAAKKNERFKLGFSKPNRKRRKQIQLTYPTVVANCNCAAH